MRIVAFVILASATIFATPGQAQTYDPSYPVCLKVYSVGRGGGEYNECRYTSLAQCNASASGRAASCEINPWYANAGPSGRPDRRRQRSY